MIARIRSAMVATLALALTACGGGGSGAGSASTPSPPASTSPSTTTEPLVVSTVAPPASTEPTEQAASFPIATFAAISEDPVTEDVAANLQAALEGLAKDDAITENWGLAATVMTAEGTWSGAVGKADGLRDVQVDAQFAIASITKSVIAAQVMLMVEAGELGLDDAVAAHLPPDLRFDTNGATVRHLLSHRSGLPDYYDLLRQSQQTEFQRVWKPTEILELLPTTRTPPGRTFQYAETNYLLLSLVIEQLRSRPLVDVLREGALAVDGLDRLVYQPEERPTEPIAVPGGGEATAYLEFRGGYLPSLASATAFHASGAIASDSRTLARWWRAFCAGEIVSQASLTEMSTFPEGQAADGAYGLGLYNPGAGYADAVGHTGELFGYMSWAACLPKDEAVIVVLTNRLMDDGQFAFSHGLARPLVDVLHSG